MCILLLLRHPEGESGERGENRLLPAAHSLEAGEPRSASSVPKGSKHITVLTQAEADEPFPHTQASWPFQL